MYLLPDVVYLLSPAQVHTNAYYIRIKSHIAAFSVAYIYFLQTCNVSSFGILRLFASAFRYSMNTARTDFHAVFSWAIQIIHECDGFKENNVVDMCLYKLKPCVAVINQDYIKPEAWLLTRNYGWICAWTKRLILKEQSGLEKHFQVLYSEIQG